MIQPQFADTDVALLASGIQRYQEIGAYCETPVMSEESFELFADGDVLCGRIGSEGPLCGSGEQYFCRKSSLKDD